MYDFLKAIIRRIIHLQNAALGMVVFSNNTKKSYIFLTPKLTKNRIFLLTTQEAGGLSFQNEVKRLMNASSIQ